MSMKGASHSSYALEWDFLFVTILRKDLIMNHPQRAFPEGIRVALFLLACASSVCAEEAPVLSTSAALTGESVSVQAPQAMTDASSAGVFLTLTRSSYGREALPSYAATVTPELFRGFDAQNAGDAITRQTSVQLKDQGGLGSFRLAGIRGATSNQTLVLLDGRPVGGVGLSGSQDLSEIPLEQIDRIEIVRGGASALYGPNAVGGVINVISKRSTHVGFPIAHFGYELRSFGGDVYRLNAGSRIGPLDYYFFGNQQRESGFRDNSDAKAFNLGGNAGFSMGKGGKVLLDVASYHNNAGSPGQIYPDLPVNQYDGETEKQAASPNARQITDSRYLRTSYLLPLPMNSLAALRLFGSEREVAYKDPDYSIDTDRDEQSKGGELQVDLPMGFMVGGTFIRDRLDSQDHTTPANNFIASVENWGVFLQDTLPWKKLTLIPSLRYDHHSQAGESTSPRLLAIADATPWLRLSGSAAQSFRAPTIDDLYTPFTDFGYGFSYQGNPNLNPEEAWTYDAGFELHEDSASVKVTYFRANVTDLIQTTIGPTYTTVNVGTARRQGGEFEVAHFAGPGLRHSVNYTYLDNQGIPQGYEDYVTLRLSPHHTVNDLLTWKPDSHWTVDNNLRYVSASYEGNDESGDKLEDHFLWDMRLGYQVRQLEFYLGVNNITDKRYHERSGYPLPGRTYFGGASLRLWG